MVFIGFSDASAQLLQWNTFGNLGTELTEPSIFNDPNISSTNLTQGTITAAANANRFGGSGWFDAGNTVAGNTLAEAIAGNDYIQFIVTPNSGFSFTPTSFVFQWDKSGTGPKNVTLRSSVDGYTTDLGSLVPVAAIGTSNTITISGLNNITTVTTFRLYGYGATATGGTGGFDVGSNIVNVQLNGTTASAGSPAINVTPASLTGFTALSGVPTAEQTYSVDGSLLTGNITITPPVGFEITKTSGSGYVSNPGTITLIQLAGSVAATPIYVRMNSATLGTNTGNITHTSTGSNNPSVLLTGHVITTEPTVQSAITIPAPTITTFGMLVNFSGGDGAKRILVAHLGSAVNSNPVDGVTYTASTNFGSGTQIGTGNYVVYAGTGNSVTVTGLTPSTTYHFAVYDYNDAGLAGAENYLTTTSPGRGNATTLTSDGDFRSIAIGPWSDIFTWQVRVADNWVAAASIPTASSNVYIQAGHTVTVDIASVSCNDLHLNITGVLAIAGNIVELSGKLRAYTGTTTITAGADGTFYSGQINTTSVGNSITTTTGVGKLKVIGNTRSITYTGEWGNNPANWDVEFAPTAGQTFTIQTGFKAGNITVASGTVLSTSTDLRPDGGALNTGSLTVKSGAALQFSNAAITIQRVSAAGVGSHFGTLTVEAGGTLEFSGTSNPIIGAGAIAFNGAVIYSGAGNQNLAVKAGNSAAVDPNIYTDLTISGGGNKTLPIPVAVNGVLNLTNGFVISTAINLLSMSSTASVTGASNTSFVSGPVAKTGSTGFVFPVGKTGTGYVPVGIGSLSGSETFTAEYIRADPTLLGPINAGGLLSISRCEYWTLNRLGAINADVSLYWSSVNNCAAAPYIASLPSLTVAHFGGVDWDSYATAGNTTGDVTTGSVTWTGVSTFSPFTIGTVSFINPLAVSLNYLRGVKQGNAHLLNWKVTCSSTPSATLSLERSADGISFKSIYSITADALRCAQPFEYNDAQPVAGTNYYRLKMTDANGKTSYSNIITLINAGQGFDIMHIAPNPVTGNNFTLNISSAKATQMNIVISDLQGRVVKQASLSLIAGYNTSEINIQSLAPGTYQLYGSNGTDKSKLIRFVKQ